MPGDDQQQALEREKLIRWLLSGDIVIVLSRIPFAYFSGSLALYGEVVRSSLMVAVSWLAFTVMYMARRGRFRRFEFGIDKIEQFISLVAGLVLIGSAGWIAFVIALRLAGVGEPPSPLGLALAALFSAINFTRNLLGYFRLRGESDGSALFEVILRSRYVLMVVSGIVQVVLTLAVLARDPVIGLLLDAGAAAYTVGLMVLIGFRMVRTGLPVILDVSAEPNIRDPLHEILPAGAQARTRRLADRAIAEIALPHDTPHDLREAELRLAEAIGDAGAPIEFAVVLRPRDQRVAGFA